MSNEACNKVRNYLFDQGARGRDEGAPDCVRLDDLTTAGTFPNYTNPWDWGGLNPKTHDWGVWDPTLKELAYKGRLHSVDAEGPKQKVPGLQIDAYFHEDTSQTTLTPGNVYGKIGKDGKKVYRYDSQFVIRFPDPDYWEGRLMISGAPGVRGQYANDLIIGDYALSKGCAYASIDKGNTGLRFYSSDQNRGEAVAEWHHRIKQIAKVAKEASIEYYGNYGKELKYTYITGTSNGGYLTRYALENDAEDPNDPNYLYDGGVDWQGPLWTDPEKPSSDPEDKGPNLFTFLPQALKYYPLYPLRDARNALIRAGFEPDQDFLWPYYYDIYWNSTQRIYREEFDPTYAGADADYNYAERLDTDRNPFVAQAIKGAVKQVSLTGEIKKRLITLHGTLDALLPITKSSDKYAKLVEKAERSDMHRYYRIEGGTHVDSLYDSFPDKLQPMLPCYRAAFDRLVEWVEEEKPPPEN